MRFGLRYSRDRIVKVLRLLAAVECSVILSPGDYPMLTHHLKLYCAKAHDHGSSQASGRAILQQAKHGGAVNERGQAERELEPRLLPSVSGHRDRLWLGRFW